ncbi:MAG: hypothetical protein HYU36_24945 [Planctomycetes bacterium]|nr:hypothetical protein [Planctomycetota bacterium]
MVEPAGETQFSALGSPPRESGHRKASGPAVSGGHQALSAQHEYPYLEVSGTPFEMGLQHGHAVPDSIHRFLEMIFDATTNSDRPRDAILKRTLRVVPLLETHAPRFLEEIRGLAAGAQIRFEEAVLLQLRGEVAQIPDGACTTYAISGRGTATTQILIGQNSDMGPDQEEVGLVLRLAPDRGPRILMWTFAGHLGYHGMNSQGVAHFANALGGGPPWRFGLSHYPLKRLMLERRTLAEILDLAGRYPVCSSGNYALSTGCGRICNLEITPAGYDTLGPGEDGFIAHSNHFLCSPWACPENHQKSLTDSFSRLARIRHLIASRFGHIRVSDVQQFLSDHDHYPFGICRHPHDGRENPGSASRGKTVCSLVAEPENGRLHVCKGNPCQGSWKTYEV